MIPIKLSLRNFLSYGAKPQEINFGLHPLICFSGKNGHGKSALLDAITWGIWGQARKVGVQSKPDAHLLRLGQSSMMVCIDVLSNNTRYRIKREFALTKASHPFAQLEFGIIDQQDQLVKNLTEKTIRHTQETIDRVLGVSFETFVNTAFLRQGNANEFSKKSPKDRKEILAQILQLGQFDALKKAAYERAKEFLQEIENYTIRKQSLERELEQQEILEKKQVLLEEELKLLSNEELLCKQQQNVLEQKLLEAAQNLAKIRHIISYDKQLEQDEQEQYKKLTHIVKQWRTAHKKLRSIKSLSPDIRKELVAKLNNLQKLQKDFFDHKAQLISAQSALETHVKQKKLKHEIIKKNCEIAQETKYGELKKNYALKEQANKDYKSQEQELKQYQEEHKNICAHITRIKQECDTLEEIEQQFEKRKIFYHKWLDTLHRFKQEINHIKRKRELIRPTAKGQACCPLCRQQLSAQYAHNMDIALTKEQHSLCNRYRRLAAAIKELKNLLLQQHTNLLETRSKLKRMEMFISQEQNLSLLIKKISHDLSEKRKYLIELNANINLLQKEIAHADTESTIGEDDSTSHKLQQQIDILQQKINNHLYKPEEHQALINAWQKEQDQQQDMLYEQEQKLQQQRWFTFLNLKDNLKKIYTQRKKCHISYAQEQQIEQEKEHISQQKSIHETNRKHLQDVREKLLQEKARTESTLKSIYIKKEELELIKCSLKSLEQEAHDYVNLSSIFSRDGIQALLIEDALPEIEQEANNLLSQLTQNQSHIIIESLRDLKKGGVKETLDIKISDTMGIRPYELFSGGEAFRIDFALRIAISKLLARRAGTSLQTLIIDEGFGSQDEEGLSLLMDTIHHIQHEFAKIIIVSHLPQLKDQFPVHFLIHKSNQGSTVNIVEH